jgi:hypothetical protein
LQPWNVSAYANSCRDLHFSAKGVVQTSKVLSCDQVNR